MMSCFCLAEIVWIGLLVLDHAVDEPVRAEKKRVASLTVGGSKCGSELSRTAHVRDRTWACEKIARLDVKSKGLGCFCEVFAGLGAAR